MKFRSWYLVSVVGFGVGCGVKTDQTTAENANHGTTLEKHESKFAWGPAAPEAPLTPSPVPQMPEQPGSPKNPGDGGMKESDKMIPSTTASPR